MKANRSTVVLLAVVALLVVLLGWESWNYGRLHLEAAFAEEQTQIFEEMQNKAAQGSATEAAEALEYVMNYYPSGTKQRAGSRLDKVVERMRGEAVQQIIASLRRETGEDLGGKPEAWITKYANKK